MERIVVVLRCPPMFPSDLWLAVNERVWPAVCVRVSDVKIPHRVALPVLLRQNHPSPRSPVFLTHHCLIVGGGAVGGWDESAVAMRGDVVWPGDVAGDGGVGGHGGGLKVVLRVG